MTIVDVAKHAGVSVASASKVVRNAYGASSAMRERVMASVESLGYRPHRLAQGLRGPTKTIGVLVSDIENPFFDLLLAGAGEVFAESEHEMFLALAGTSGLEHAAATESLIDHRMDGLILVAPRGTPASLERFGREIPTVVVGRHGPAEAYDTVSGDDATGLRLVVEHLAALGHRHISFLENESDANESLPENVRLAAYRAALRDLSLGPPDSFRVPWTAEGGRSAARILLERRELPTAVFTGADIVALGLLSELWDHGVAVPGELSVVGYDDSPTAQLRPIGLTSVNQSGQLMGRLAAHLLLERIAGRTVAQHELLLPELRPRTTSGPVRGGSAR